MNTQIFQFNKYDLKGHKVPKGHLSFREFNKFLHNTFIYELILIKFYMKTISMNTQIFYFYKYDLKGH